MAHKDENTHQPGAAIGTMTADAAGSDPATSDTASSDVTTWPAPTDWAGWAATWEARMQAFFARRQACVAAILDLLAELLPAGPARILDLGAGTGSLSGPILARFPAARVVALDLDPVLLTIGRGALGDADGRLSWRQLDLRAEAWPQALAADGPFDAVVSLATLHHFNSRELGSIYRALAGLLRPGGLLINAEGLAAGRPNAPLSERFNEIRKRGAPPSDGFWEAIAANPALAEAVAERERLRDRMRGAAPRISAEAHVRALRRAGFQDAAIGWRWFDEAAVVGLR